MSRPKVCITTIKQNQDVLDVFKEVKQALLTSNTKLYLDENCGLANHTSDIDTINISQLPAHSVLLVLGGDGTILNFAQIAIERNLILMGLNLGRLGYLTAGNQSDISECVQAIANVSYIIEQRALLEVSSTHLHSTASLIALNEVVVHRASSPQALKYVLTIDDMPAAEHYADGIIVATATGSTAYNLSAGGPILYATSKDMVITPICAHNLYSRPLIISEDMKIKIEIMPTPKTTVNIDGKAIPWDSNFFYIQSSNQRLRIAKLPGHGFISDLKKKLYWAQS